MGAIRFLLALSVLIVHSSSIFGITLLPGYLAVQAFYIISGYYMALIYNEKYLNTKRPKYFFYTNRLLRVYPPYLLIVLLIVGLSIVFGLSLGSFGKLQFFFDAYKENKNSLSGLIIIGITNITLIGQDVISFFGIAKDGTLHFLGLQENIQLQEFMAIPIAWTVAVELFFYVLTPFFVSKKLEYIFLLLFSILLLRLLLFVLFDVNKGFDIFRFAPTELLWFVLGVLSYRLCELNVFPKRKCGKVLWVITLTVLLFYNLHKYDWLVFGIIVVCMPAIFCTFSSNRYDRYLGELTYPLYISHMFFMMIVSANRFPKDYGAGLPLLGMTLVFSIVSYHFFVSKIDQIRLKRALLK